MNKEYEAKCCLHDILVKLDRICKKKYFSDYTLINFENDKFSIIKDYELYPKHVYGDYMKLPPAKERCSRHKILKIDLENYKNIFRRKK